MTEPKMRALRVLVMGPGAILCWTDGLVTNQSAEGKPATMPSQKPSCSAFLRFWKATRRVVTSQESYSKSDIVDAVKQYDHVDLAPKKNPMKRPGSPRILQPSIPKKPETATLNLSILVLCCISLAYLSSTFACSAFSYAISRYSSIFSKFPPCSLTISSISFITYKFFSILLAIAYISSGLMRSWEERIQRMMTDLTAIFCSSSCEYDTDVVGCLLNLPPLPISSFIFQVSVCSISLHLIRMSSI